MRILVLITALLWAGVSGWWYTCNIKGYCDADPKEASLVDHTSADKDKATEKDATEDASKNSNENDVESNENATTETQSDTDKTDDSAAETPLDTTSQKDSTVSEDDTATEIKAESTNTETNTNENTNSEEESETKTDETVAIDALESALNDETEKEIQPNPLEEDIAAEDDDDETKIKINRVNNAYKGTDVVPTIKKVRIYSPSNVSKQTALNTNATRYFDKVISLLKTDTTLEITLTGYTDSKGGAARNKTLGLRRAKTLKAILVAKGAPADQIITDSLGEANPVWSNKSEAGRKKNRRVEIESKTKEE